MQSSPMDLSLIDKFFHISLKGSEDAIVSIPAIELLQREKMDMVIHKSSELFKARGLELSASFIGMSIFGLCASLQLVLASYNRLLDLSLPNLTFQLEMHHDHLHGCFQIHELRYKEAPVDGREQWLAAELTEYYRNNVNPVVEFAAQSAGVKPDLIWNQYGARMAFGLDFVLEHEKNEAVRNRFEQDYELLKQGLKPDVFGRRKNPFEHKPRYIDSLRDPNKKVIMRSSCCMYDRRENGEKCFNCPQMLPEEREARRENFRATQEHPA
jgi:ferric iron reductase protein FhuF